MSVVYRGRTYVGQMTPQGYLHIEELGFEGKGFGTYTYGAYDLINGTIKLPKEVVSKIAVDSSWWKR